MKRGMIGMGVCSLCMVIAIFSGCDVKKKQTTIAFCFQDLETEFWIASHKAITGALQAKGIKVIEKNANEDANRQFEQVKDLITQGVNGIILIPQDGQSALTIIGECNQAGIPIGIFNRPPADDSKPALVVVANNEKIAEASVEYMKEQALLRNRKAVPLIIVGDLGDPNAVHRRKGFYNVIERNPELFEKPIEVPSKWDAPTALANLQSALEATPNVDFIFTSSDFLYPQIKSVLSQRNKWVPAGDPNHVILGGLDGDATACELMKEKYVDATGVQDLFTEAKMMVDAMLAAIANGEKTPAKWMDDPGFALTQRNIATQEMAMWGCVLAAKAQVEKTEDNLHP